MRARVDYLIDGVMAHDLIDGETVNAKIMPPDHPDQGYCRGYVKTPARELLYAAVFRIVIVDDTGPEALAQDL